MKREPSCLAGMLVGAFALLATGCGGSGSSGVQQPPPDSHPGTVRAQDSARDSAPSHPVRQAVEDPLSKYDRGQVSLLTGEARILAGMPVEGGSPLAGVQSSRAWQGHARFLDGAFRQLETGHLAKIRNWSAAELGGLDQTTVFYPFSGPDFLFAYEFFPKGKQYILVGLEPVGRVRELGTLSEQELGAKLKWIQQSLSAILQFSFFRTNDMKVDMAEDGVLPILFVFLARTGNSVLDVAYVDLQGRAVAAGSDPKGIPAKPVGVKIDFLPQGQDSPRTMYYFSVDLTDYSLQGKREFTRFVKSFPRPATYLKAASYLMHHDVFMRTRSIILARSSSLLQDDSGIPFKEFDARRWDLKLYGTYSKPINLFEERYQPDLLAAYKARGGSESLNFGVGYKHRTGESNLMLAVAKNQPAQRPADCPQGRELLAKGQFAQAADAFKNAIDGQREIYSIRVEVACQPSSVAEDVRRAQGAPGLFVLPGDVNGRACFRVFWGLYPSKADAVSALDELPDSLVRGASPIVVRLDASKPRG